VGVIGALAGVVGSMMALEAIKLITGAGESLSGRLLVYDALAAVTRTVRIAADPRCTACGLASSEH
jgi:molybdopterin/thiamine biosynthesis adenylyltransferase